VNLTQYDRDTAKRLREVFTERGFKLLDGTKKIRQHQRAGALREVDRCYEVARLLGKLIGEDE